MRLLCFFPRNQTKHEKHSKLTRSQDLCHNHNCKSKQRRGKHKANNRETFEEKGLPEIRGFNMLQWRLLQTRAEVY
jgi:hypothetical protein